MKNNNKIRITFYKGRKNKTINPDFVNLCMMNQIEMKKYLEKQLRLYYPNVISQDGFLYVKGKDKIALTAHMDTVHKDKIKTFYEIYENGQHKITSPEGIGGDDRCGIYMILEILKRTSYRPTIIFCEDEEIGCIGSSKFVMSKFINNLKKMYFMIELDRRGNNDVVFYEDENEVFWEYVEKTTGYKLNYGSCSDISELAPAAGVSAVNISCGYYNEHTSDEYVVLEDMEESIKRTIKLIKDGLKKKVQYEYQCFYGNDYSYDGESILYVSYKYNDKTYDTMISCTDENDGFKQFFKTYSDVCWNDIVDYDFWENSYNQGIYGGNFSDYVTDIDGLRYAF